MIVNLDTFNKVMHFAHVASTFTEDVIVGQGGYKVNGKSFLGLLSLDLSKPLQVYSTIELELQEKLGEK